MLEQPLGELLVSLAHGHEHRRATILVLAIDVGAGREQPLRHCEVTQRRGVMQRRESFLVSGVRIDPPPQETRHALEIPVLYRLYQVRRACKEACEEAHDDIPREHRRVASHRDEADER